MARDERGGRRRGRVTRGRGAEPSVTGSPRPAPSRVRQEILEWGKTIVLTVVFLIVIRSFLIQTFVITSGSMEDTLLVGDFLMVNRLSLGTRLPGTLYVTPGYSEPDRGDVLVFDPHHEEGIKLVKRLIGMPGDTLEMREKHLYVNGALRDEPYVKWADMGGDGSDPRMIWQRDYLVAGTDPSTYRPTRDTWGPLVVPEGRYFMLGDNRDFSYDSRYWGLIERWRLEGRAMFFYFSYDRDSPTPFSFLREIRWNRIGRGIH